MDIAALKATAEVASPGEWTLGGSTKQRVEIGNLTVAFFGESMSFGVDGSFSITREEAAANAAFVALANPTSILSLIARLEALEEALRPFAATAEVDIGESETAEDMFQQASHNRAPKITVGDFRRAKAALEPTP